MVKSAYIHIPFCKSKCKYCSFISSVLLDLKEAYLSALIEEINCFYKGEKLDTIYFGGGTPSVLNPEDFSRLLNLFNYDNETEITIEVNPDNLNLDYMKDLKSIGINRVSIGCQTFDDNILKLIGRRHNSKQVYDAVSFSNNAGFTNISLDFIYGLPSQTIEGFESDLKKAISLKVPHISLYGLKIEPGSYFYLNTPKSLPDEDMQADMYLKALDILKEFNHYEISNFGLVSRHNINYWNNNHYYGFGLSAHGYVDGIRYSNSVDLDFYIKYPKRHYCEHLLSMQEKLEEEIFLGFRKIKGINIQNINKRFNIDFEQKYEKVLSKYKDYFDKSQNYYALNTSGILVSNVILSEFLE